MIRANAITFLLLHFLASTELHEIVRMPIAFIHFAEHKQQNNDVSFLDFGVLHYFSGRVKDANYERDRQLPFKKFQCEELASSVALPVDPFEEPLPGISYTTLKVEIYVSRFHSSLFQFSIWQPPRA